VPELYGVVKAHTGSPPGQAVEVELDPETFERLKSLGYIGD